MPQATPVSSGDRLETLDVLRGFALLGILVMNIRAMAGPFGSYLYPLALYEYADTNRAAFLFTTTFFDLKMMGLFSMLFGASALLYAGKAEAAGGLTGLWFRRMFWLLVIGLTHAYLIWDGDILVPYALCGMLVLWWVRRWSARTLLVAGALTLLVGAGLGLGHGFAWDSMSDADRAEELKMMMPTPEQNIEELGVLRTGYLDVVRFRAPTVLVFQTFFFAVFFFWRCSGMMLLGMGLYKSGFLEGRLPMGKYATTAALALPLGLGLAAYGAMELDRTGFAMPARLFLDLWNYTGAILASIGYAAAVVLLVKRQALAGLRRRLAAVGQMALTNYLLHSIVTAFIFLGWGLGFAGRLDYFEQLFVVIAIWAAQLALSPIWLARFRFGPVEWLWRSLTYGAKQPMRRGTPPREIGAASAGV